MSTFDTPLDCDGVTAVLADYLDDDAPDALRAAVELHASSCASCSQLLADLAAIRHDAAALPLLVPSRDLWDGIADRIEARVVPLDAPAAERLAGRPVRLAGQSRGWLRPAMAAAALVTITAGVTHYMTRAALAPSAAATQVASTQVGSPVVRDTLAAAVTSPVAADAAVDSNVASGARSVTAGRTTVAAASPAASPAAAPGSRSPNRTSPSAARQDVSGATGSARLASMAAPLADVDPVYAGEIRTLRKIVRERRTQLDPATVAVLEQSIAVIDSAIAQSRAALAKDPASGFLATQLNRSLDKKVELLRTVASLPART